MYAKTQMIQVLELHRGYDLPEKDRHEGTVPVISSAGYSGSHDQYKCEGENVITGRYGTIGEVFYHEGKCWPLNTALYVSNFKGNYPRYVYYLLKYVLKSATDGKDKSTVPGVDRNVLHQMNIPFCEEIRTQKEMVRILVDIDKKIETNIKINDNLAQQLRLLYDYWFTQFDFPDESGNPYRSSGGQMVWNNGLKRKIPESWCVVPLGEVSSFRNGINYDKNTTGDTTYHIVNVRNISSSSILLDERELDEICLPCTQAEKYLVSNESILIARSGIPGAPRILYNPSEDIIFCGFIICATPIDRILQHYLMLFLKQLEGSTATQTGGSILKNVSQDTLRDLLVPIPSKDILTQFNQRVALIYEFMHNNLEETSKLQNLRDWLLPMLMNGQATISD